MGGEGERDREKIEFLISLATVRNKIKCLVVDLMIIKNWHVMCKLMDILECAKLK